MEHTAAPPVQKSLKVFWAGDLYILKIVNGFPPEVEIFADNRNVEAVAAEWENLPHSVRNEFTRQLRK
jgi:hypothetical protein